MPGWWRRASPSSASPRRRTRSSTRRGSSRRAPPIGRPPPRARGRAAEWASGERLGSDKVARARGHAEGPRGEAELFDKFRTCLDAGHARVSPETLFDRLRRLETLLARELTAIG